MSITKIISVVDDDASVRAATEGLVRSLGFAAYGFASAEAFLASPLIDATACLITDVQMPGMSGLELQAELASQGRDIPVIFITAFPEDRLRRQASAGGAIGFLAKPFDGSTMIRCIETAVGEGK